MTTDAVPQTSERIPTVTTPTFATGLLLANDPVTTNLSFGLFGGPSLNGNALALTDVPELTCPGYGRAGAAAWQDAEVPSEKIVTRRSKSHEFRCTGASPGTFARGYFVTAWDGATNVLLDIKEFDSPLPMDAVGKNVVLQLEVTAFDDAVYPT